MNTIIYVESAGDASVGIKRSQVKIEFDHDVNPEGDEELREQIREDFKAFFKQTDILGDSSIGVRYQEECPDCGSKRELKLVHPHPPRWFCSNPSCL